MLVTGTGIPAGSYITAIGTGTITISKNLTATATGAVKAVPVLPFVVGMPVGGTNVPAGAYVTAVNATKNGRAHV